MAHKSQASQDPGPRLGLGIDVGSVNVHAALCGPDQVVWSGAQPVKGRLLPALHQLLLQLQQDGPLWQRGEARLVTTVVGVGRAPVADALHADTESEVVALAEAARLLCPEARCLLEVGGHTSRWVALDPAGEVASFALSEPCAAGTGAFIEQQAARLQLDVEGLSQAASRAQRGVPVAGRCSVFAKSDMIHLQQKGVAVEEIAYGLCLAVARNIVSTLIRGQQVTRPLCLLGGAARNQGLRRALREMLALGGEGDLLVPEWADHFPAVGAALLAVGQPRRQGLPLSRLLTTLERARALQPRRPSPLPRLSASATRGCQEPRVAPAEGEVRGYLGIDVGSVSTNLVLLDQDADQVLDGVYLPTQGRPMQVLAQGLQELHQRLGDRLRVLGAGTTGSGRHLAAGLLGADVVHNEITCQLESALRYVPQVDTVIEIGGQDSKFIRARGGRLHDFTMNKICAAGTGSFLEEEARRLDVAIVDQFSQLALGSAQPANLGCRCTVFMDTDVVNAQSRGDDPADLCAGLAYAIARNYLERVVERRPIGQHVVMQGGVASNAAVVAAFSQLLGRPVHVHPYGRISGAIGAALLAHAWRRRQGSAARPSAFRGLDALVAEQAPRVGTFECPRCENRCQVSRITLPAVAASSPRKVHFGDACERYSVSDRTAASTEVPDLFALRDELLTAEDATEPAPTAATRTTAAGAAAPDRPARPRAAIGLPRASVLWGQLPFWRTLLQELGFAVRLSRRSSPQTLELGTARLPAETCLPIKLAFGHVRQLLEQEQVDAVLLPAQAQLGNWSGDQGLTCPYTDALPHMVAAATGPEQLLAPELPQGLEQLEPLVQALAPLLARWGVSAAEVTRAARRAEVVQRQTLTRLRQLGAAALREHPDLPVLPVLGRPYTLSDSFLNLNLGRHLRRLGLLALPMDMLPRGPAEAHELGALPWRANRDTMVALSWAISRRDAFPVLLTSFGCGPDGFMDKHLPVVLDGRPTLQLELDEHRAEAGLVTRLEALADAIKQHQRDLQRAPRDAAPLITPKAPRARGHYAGRRLWVPFISDHSHAFAGAFRFAGLDARVLPPPDEALMARSETMGSGKECHPYLLLAADLDRLAADHRPGDLFYIPGSTLPCLIQQYGPGMERMLQARGIDDLELLSPTMPQYWDVLGTDGYFRLYCGLFAIDLLLRAVCSLRPYERCPGVTDAVHRTNLDDLQDSLAGDEIGAVLRRCRARLQSIETVDRHRRRPLVGIAGDIYTRVNDSANRNLFTRLEAMGCEVWPAPFLTDLVEYGLLDDLRRTLAQRRLRPLPTQLFVLAAQQMGSWVVRRGLGAQRTLVPPWGEASLRCPGELWREEPSLDVCLQLAERYVGRAGNELVRWNVAKMVDFARRGAHGIVNAVGQSCMVGTVSAAVGRRIRSDHDNIPLVTLYYGASENDTERASLEAFAHQVSRRHAAQLRGERPAPSAQHGGAGIRRIRGPNLDAL